MLCKACSDVFDRPLHEILDAGEASQPTSSALIAAAESCYICRSLMEIVTREHQSAQLPDPSTFSANDIAAKYSLANFDKEDTTMPPERMSLRCFFCPPWNTIVTAGHFRVVPKRDDSFYMNDNLVNPDFDQFTWIRKLIDECARDHAKCKNITDESGSFAPTRLVDLFSTDSEVFRVIDTATEFHSHGTHYAALSHRWGSASILMLRQPETIDQLMKQNSSVKDLPRTFRDAIHVTQRLGLRYLWIDSLCIIQNSRSDWAHEAARMGRVYQNCLVNIAASAATDPHDGFLKTREVAKIRPCFVRIKSQDRPDVEYNIIETLFLRKGLEMPSLQQRAWVMQERCLAPRTVHFGNEQVFFECREMDACETFPRGVPPVVLHGRIAFKYHPIYHKSGVTIPEMSTPYEYWNTMVYHYSVCGLTKESDKLVAIGGLARLMQEVTGDQYIAGLWRSQFPRALLWRPKGAGLTGWSTSPPRRAREYRAPSWSWASIEGTVFLAPLRTDVIVPLAQLVDAVVVNEPINVPFMQVRSAELHINSFLVAITLGDVPQPLKAMNSRYINIHVDGIEFKTLMELDEWPRTLSSTYAIPIEHIRRRTDQRCLMSCLLVEQVVGHTYYSRFGVMWLLKSDVFYDTVGLKLDENSGTACLTGDSTLSKERVVLV